MSTKVDQASIHTVNMSTATTTTTTPSSAGSNAGTKISKFGAKAGFVIPKNKLSGSLVPVFRGGKKAGSDYAINEEEKVSKVQRKTKWGTDPTQDAAVRRGRALAYQTRVDQIAQQLESGSLEVEDNRGSEVAAQNTGQKSSNLQVDGEKLELLQLEKREAIGEILKLNPNYKAPPDYKPLLKEAIVPIPVKDYRGYNFLGLIFGPASDTQKRVEKETGTIIKVYGAKADTGEKVEISTSDGNFQGAYEELYINISADTYEKVDAAADLIELLVSSVSGSLASISTPTLVSEANVDVLSQGQGEGTPFMVPNAVVNQGIAQPVVGPMQTPPHGQFQDRIPWFPSGPPQNPMHHMNSSAPILTNPINMPSLFGPRPGTAAGFPSILQTPAPVPPSSQSQMQVPPRPYMPQVHSGTPRNFPMPAPQPSSAQSNMGSLHFTGIQLQPTGPFAVGKPSMPLLPHSVSRIPPRPLPDWPLIPANAPASLGSSNMGQLIQGHRTVISQPIPFPPPPNISAANMVSPASFPSQASSSAMDPPPSRVFGSGPPPLVGSSPAFPALQPSQIPGSSPTPVPSISRPTMQAGISGSVSGGKTNFSSINSSSATAPRPQHPSSGDFTFQPHRPQNPAPLVVPRPSGMLNTPSPRLMAQVLAPQAAPQPIMQVPQPQFGNQMGQPQALTSAVLFAARNPNAAFANVSPVSPAAPSLQMGPRNFGPGPQPYAAGPFPPRPGNPLQLNYPAPTNRPHMGMNQQFGNNRIGGPQIYDPFSPTSASIPPQQQGEANPARARKLENDPEYEDLMASVGVK